MKNAKKILWTTLLLTASSFAMKTVGVWFNVYLSGSVGAAGLGLWNLILSVYFMLKTVSAAGMSLLSTRLVIDEPECLRGNLKRLYTTSLLTGTGAMLILLIFAPGISRHLLGSTDGIAALRLLGLSLPFLAMSTCTGGYSTASRKMPRYALLQMAEQALRIGVSILTLCACRPLSIVKATLCLALGITAGEMFSFVTGLLCVTFDLRKTKDSQASHKFYRKWKNIALPDGAGSIFRSLLSTLQNILIPKGMRKNGTDYQSSLEAYGRVHGMALPVVLYPSSLLGVLSGLLVPEIAASKARGRMGHVRYVIYRVLHPALIFSVAVAGVMLGFSKELSQAVYASQDPAAFIRLLAPLVPVMYMDMTSDGLLKGLGLQKQIMAINVADSVISVIMIYFLVPVMGIYGYVFMIYFTELFNFIFSFVTLLRHSRFPLQRMKASLLLPLWMTSALVITNILCTPLAFPSATTECCGKILLCVGVYLLLCIAGGVLTKEDMRWMKKVIQ